MRLLNDYRQKQRTTVRMEFWVCRCKMNFSHCVASSTPRKSSTAHLGHSARSNSDAATQMMKSTHARGPEPFLPHTVGDGPLFIEKNRDPTVVEIHKAHGKPRGLHPHANRQVDMDTIAEMLKHVRRLRKLGLPTQSDNAGWDDRHANTGASNDWRDETAPSNKPSQLGPSHATSISAARHPAQDLDADPTVAALKAIFKAGPKRF